MVHKGGDLDGLTSSFEPGDCSLVLAKRVQLGNVQPSPGFQHSSSFSKDEVQILDVFEDEVTARQLKCVCRTRPWLGDIADREKDIRGMELLPGLLQHTRGKIEGQKTLTTSAQEVCVLTGTTTEFQA